MSDGWINLRIHGFYGHPSGWERPMAPNAPAYPVPSSLPVGAKEVEIDCFLTPDISVFVGKRKHLCEQRRLDSFSPGERVFLFMPGHDLLTLCVADVLPHGD